MKRVVYVLIALLFSPSVLATSVGTVPQELTESHSFENDLEGWSLNAIFKCQYFLPDPSFAFFIKEAESWRTKIGKVGILRLWTSR